MLVTRHCALPECGLEFQTDNLRKQHCSKAHANPHQVRLWRAKRRKGGGGGGNGGGGAPLFEGHDEGLFATVGGAVEVASSGSVSDKNRYSVKPSSERKPARAIRSSGRFPEAA